jgi:flagellar hook protein FlgE
MNAALSTALSGLHAAEQRIAASGHNLANLATAGFRRQTVETATVPSGGVTTTVRTAEQPGDDMASDLVNLSVAKHAFGANLAVFKTHDQMLGTLLDAES